MSGAIPPHSPNTPSWRGAQLKHRDNFTFTFTFNWWNVPAVIRTEMEAKYRFRAADIFIFYVQKNMTVKKVTHFSNVFHYNISGFW